ncbi:NACHT, LRR and PYD domains-containing protein 3 isoform X2 [Carassius auratus]|uniref:NACHT, LRR and PYD domains-containing protein 3 isoform X2 n=1 Tax=Carassius auratus TaxID=7957 RepID=A0A6P6JXN9_CARAU|nr:NACHT, LRR and PYD domains-containing protein 3-like isoform X2 [Carassius auratus]
MNSKASEMSVCEEREQEAPDHPQRAASPGFSFVSMKSNNSMNIPPVLGDVHPQRAASPGFSCVSMKSNDSMIIPPVLGDVHPQRAGSPGFSCVSMKSNDSMIIPPGLSDHAPRVSSPGFSCVSMKSNDSMIIPPVLGDVHPQRAASPGFSCVSMKSNNSMIIPPVLGDVHPQRAASPGFSCVSMKSNDSMIIPPVLGDVHPQRAASPGFSCVSMKSNDSMIIPPGLSDHAPRVSSPGFSCVSMKSNDSMIIPPVLGDVHPQRAASPGFSCVSMKSNDSMIIPPVLGDVHPQRAASPGFSCVSMKSNDSMIIPPVLGDVHPQRAGSPGFSCVSMKSNDSMIIPPVLGDVHPQRAASPGFSCVSMKSNDSMIIPPVLGDVHPQRAASPGFSCVSMKSNDSMIIPPVLGDVHPQRAASPGFSCVSMKSNDSMIIPPVLSDVHPQRAASPGFSCVSVKSNDSMIIHPVLGDVHPQRASSPGFSCVSVKSNDSMIIHPELGDGPAVTSHHFLISRKRKREESPASNSLSMKNHPHMFSKSAVHLYSVNDWRADQIRHVSSQTGTSSCYQNHISHHDTEAALQLDSHQPEHDDLQRVKDQHKTSMKNKYESLFEGVKLQENQTLLNSIYTQLYIIEGESEGVNEEHEVLQMEKSYRTLQDTPINCNDIFNPLPEPGDEEKRREKKDTIKTVLTKGIAGIGKTVSVQKFILDWAEGKANQDVDFMFVLTFREMNLIEDHQYSLHRLLLDFHPELQDLDSKIYDECKVVFIFDGLDESRITLMFSDSQKVSDVTEISSVGLLMSNLLRGDLLPSALIWITTRPAAANQIPSNYINRVTEIQGFNDPQKEEYFRKRISDEHQASRIISHIRRARSLHIMCHIPVFCWISSTVLQNILKQDLSAEIPQTLTEMYIYFLLIQTKMRNQKYEERHPEKLLQSNREVIVKLAELAFNQLMKGNVMFYEEDLRESGIDVTDASVYSGICTEIFREESVIYQRKVYSFVHLSFQEFFAALYVFFCYLHKNSEVLKMFLTGKNRTQCEKVSLDVFLKEAVNKALSSENGHLDLFLRFLHGVSLESNQRLLQEVLIHTENNPENIKKITQNLKRGQKNNISPERWMNLTHCLIEMKDDSVIKEMQAFLNSKTKRKKLSLAQCSTLANIILMSEEALDEFDIKQYNINAREGRWRLLPAVRNCRKAVLTDCNLTDQHCEFVASALQSSNSPLRELDLSKNHLQDSAVKLLSDGLKSPNCQLNILRLIDCNLTDQHCEFVASALQSSNSPLRELDLSKNHLQDSAVKLLSDGLKSPNCQLNILRLSRCLVTEEGCAALSSALSSNPSHLKELDLSHNHPGESAVKLINQLEKIKLVSCNLTGQHCEFVASALQSSNSPLRELVLSRNDLQDTGIKLLCAGLRSPNCQLNILRLSGCMVTEDGCAALASALSSNPSHLRELDLSYNHPGESGVKLSETLKHLDKLNVDHGGEIRITAGRHKYACDLTLDPNTAHTRLVLSEENRKVTCVSEYQSYPDHPDRFDRCPQVVCSERLTGRCYWETEWSGYVNISVCYKKIQRKGLSNDCVFGGNDISWSLICTDQGFGARHNDNYTEISVSPDSCKRVAVFLDESSGSLSFYSVSDTHTLTHLHTFTHTFTQPLHAGFYLDTNSSVSLCHIKH